MVYKIVNFVIVGFLIASVTSSFAQMTSSNDNAGLHLRIINNNVNPNSPRGPAKIDPYLTAGTIPYDYCGSRLNELKPGETLDCFVPYTGVVTLNLSESYDDPDRGVGEYLSKHNYSSPGTYTVTIDSCHSNSDGKFDCHVTWG